VGLFNRLSIVLIGLAAATAGAVIVVTTGTVQRAVLAQALQQLDRRAGLMARALEADLAAVGRDLVALRAADDIAGLVQTGVGDGDGALRLSGPRYDQWRRHAALRLAAELEARPNYLRLALTGVARRDRDIVRVERGADGRVRVLEEKDVRDGEAREHIARAFVERSAGTPASVAGLAGHGADAAVRPVPVLRSALALRSTDGTLFGALEAWFDLRPVMDRLRAGRMESERVEVVDPQGAYLATAPSASSAGRLDTDFAALTSVLAADRPSPRLVPDSRGAQFAVASAHAQVPGGPRLTVLVAAPSAALVTPAASVWQDGLLAGLAAVVVAALIAFLFARSLKRPILQMTAAVEAFGRGAAPAIPVNAGGEIGMLARAFGRMAELLDEKSAAARRSAELLDTTVASMSDAVLVLDPIGRALFANPACTALFGDGFEIGSREWQERYIRYRPDGVTPCPHEESPVGRAVRGENFDNLELVCRRLDSGDTIRIVASGRVIRSEKGSYDGAVIVYRDVTELTEKTAEIRRNAQIFHSIMASMADAVLLVDERCRVVFANRTAEELLGEHAGTGLDDWAKAYEVFLPDGTTVIPVAEWPTARAVKGENVDNFGVAVRGLDGSRLVQLIMTARPLEGGPDGPKGAVIVFRDVTDIEETERQLRHSQKMDAIGQLTGGVAHDFNNILTVITGTIEILADGVADRPKLAAIARLIDEAATRGSSLTQQLLAFARRQALQPQRTDVNTMVIEATRLLRPTLGETVKIQAVLGAEICPADIDPSQLSTALINLAVNARDAMPNGGKLTIETANVVLDESYAHDNPDARAGAYVMVAVSDTGTGIPATIIDNVFEPFFTTKEPGKGTGLGLSMVYGFVKQSGGHIKLYSEEGQGTTIKLYLPRSDRQEVLSQSVAPELPRGGGETILVVEDDEMVRTYVVAQLASLGYTTLAAGNGQAALAMVEAGTPFDLLFTDVIMPGGMNGRQLADEIARQRPGLRVLFTTGYAENALVHHGRLDPGVTVLTKPYRKAELAEKVRKALGERL
jgi:signal transduction histidine kinase/CheY-like chemotaxis protein